MTHNNLNRWFAIVNPVSGNGKCKSKWAEVEAELNAADIEFDFRFTKTAKEAERIVHDVLAQGYRQIIAVGGDGNIHDIANGLLTQNIVPSNEVKLGIISLGTGNDFVKNYAIPTNIRQAVNLIKRGKSVLHDAGMASYFSAGEKQHRFFINFCGVGFDAYVVERAAPWKAYGQMAYLLATLRWMFPYKKPTLKIITKQQCFETPCYMALAGIGRFSGGGMLLTPGAKMNDGKFTVSIAKNISKIEVVLKIAMLYNGKFSEHPQVETIETSDLKIEATAFTFPVKMQADGDMLGEGPFELSVIPGALKVIVP